jgi:hypothetical protein
MEAVCSFHSVLHNRHEKTLITLRKRRMQFAKVNACHVKSLFLRAATYERPLLCNRKGVLRVWRFQLQQNRAVVVLKQWSSWSYDGSGMICHET